MSRLLMGLVRLMFIYPYQQLCSCARKLWMLFRHDRLTFTTAICVMLPTSFGVSATILRLQMSTVLLAVGLSYAAMVALLDVVGRRWFRRQFGSPMPNVPLINPKGSSPGGHREDLERWDRWAASRHGAAENVMMLTSIITSLLVLLCGYHYSDRPWVWTLYTLLVVPVAIIELVTPRNNAGQLAAIGVQVIAAIPLLALLCGDVITMIINFILRLVVMTALIGGGIWAVQWYQKHK